MVFSFLTPPENDIALYDYWAHIAEVGVQSVAVVLLLVAVIIAISANVTANKALEGAQKDFAEERREYAKAMSDQRYDVLDKTYMELVLMRVEHPNFNEPERFYAEDASPSIADERRKYQSYAYALFNYLESVADKCHAEIKRVEEDISKKKKNREVDKSIETPDLVETWGPILVSESRLHQDWFKDDASHVEEWFKPKFRKLVRDAIADRAADPLKLLKASYG